MVVKAVQIKQLAVEGKLRYFVVDVCTGKILLSGVRNSGYRSKQYAYNAAKYYFGNRVRVYDRNFTNNKVWMWLHDHPYVAETLTAYVHHIQAGDLTPYDQINEDLISHILDFYDITDDISPKQILFTWSSSSK